MVVFDEASSVSSLLLTERHLPALHVSEALEGGGEGGDEEQEGAGQSQWSGHGA